MLIRRCAWHREFHGYTLIHGVAAWRGLSVKFTDGVCRSCAARVRIEWRVVGHDAGARRWGSAPVHRSPRRAVLAAGILLIVAGLLSIKTISDQRFGVVPGEYPLTIGDESGVIDRREARLSGEAAPPRVSRQLGAPPVRAKTRPSRRRVSGHTIPTASPMIPAMTILPPPDPALSIMVSPAPEEDLLTAEPPIQVASVVPTLSRSLAPEDEFSLRVRRASLTRLSLYPPSERLRHAGLTIQGP